MGSSEPNRDSHWQKLARTSQWLINALIVIGQIAGGILAIIALYVLLTGNNPFAH